MRPIYLYLFIFTIHKQKKTKCHLVAGLALGDGHVRHEVPEVSVPQGRRPLAHNHLARPEAGEDGPRGYHWAEGASLLLEGEEPRGEGVLPCPQLLLRVQPQHVLLPVLPPLVPRAKASTGLGLYQPHGLHVSNSLLQLELNQRQDLEGDPAVDEWLGAVDALVAPGNVATLETDTVTLSNLLFIRGLVEEQR